MNINESKTLTNCISCECNLDLMGENVIQKNGVQKSHLCENNYVGNPATCSCENLKYLVSIMRFSD